MDKEMGISSRITVPRLDRDLSNLYAFETRVLNQAVSRNLERFPVYFMVALDRDEIKGISQFVTSSGTEIRPAVQGGFRCHQALKQNGVASRLLINGDHRAV